MTRMSRDDLPENWRRPTQCLQRSLFPRQGEEFLALAAVSADELKRWRQLGWISFDPDAIQQFHDPEAYEVFFVRNIARSGLSDAQINQLLADLPKPYSYNPSITAYSFSHGWVQTAPLPDVNEVFAVIEENLPYWVDDLAEEGNLDRLRDLIPKAFELLVAKEKAIKGGGEKDPKA